MEIPIGYKDWGIFGRGDDGAGKPPYCENVAGFGAEGITGNCAKPSEQNSTTKRIQVKILPVKFACDFISTL
jgi:hypothetical protein